MSRSRRLFERTAVGATGAPPQPTAWIGATLSHDIPGQHRRRCDGTDPMTIQAPLPAAASPGLAPGLVQQLAALVTPAPDRPTQDSGRPPINDVLTALVVPMA
jgi:hypothetical protein